MSTHARFLATSLFYLGLSTLLVVGGCSNKHLVSIAVTPQAATVAQIGQTTQFMATGTTSDSKAAPEDLTSTATWSSSTPSVATVSAAGLATATGCGSTTISAQDGGIAGTTTLTVTCTTTGGGTPVLQSIDLTPSTPTIPQVGQTTQFIALGVYPAPTSTVDLTGLATWASSNTAIATVSPSGLATAVACGTTTITAEYQGVLAQTELTVSCTITNPVLQSINLYPGTPSIPQIGQLTQFIALGVYAPASTNNVLTTVAAWASSNTAIATVNSAGLATAVSCGTTTITAQYQGVIGQTLLTVSCTVGQAPVLQSINLYPSSPSIPQIGQVTQFIALGAYAPASSSNVLTSVATWASSNTAIATVNSAGLATAVACGTTTITAEYQGVIGQTLLTVSCTTAQPPVLQSINLYPSSPTISQLGQTTQFIVLAVYLPPSGNNILTSLATWASSNPAIATVDSAGLATAVSCGTTTITATIVLGGEAVVGQAPLTVDCTGNQALESITVIPNNPTIPEIGQTTQFLALGELVGGGQKDLTNNYATWASSNVDIATVGPTTGTATALNCGTSTITAEYTPTGGTPVVGTSLLTVTCVPITSIELILVKTGSVAGTVTSVPVGINCGTVCGGLFNEGTGFVLTAAPAVSSWTGCDEVIGGTCYFTLVPDTAGGTEKTVTANF
jgi:uncharacterized protein YjdB